MQPMQPCRKDVRLCADTIMSGTHLLSRRFEPPAYYDPDVVGSDGFSLRTALKGLLRTFSRNLSPVRGVTMVDTPSARRL
jgi:hypothetical protein